MSEWRDLEKITQYRGVVLTRTCTVIQGGYSLTEITIGEVNIPKWKISAIDSQEAVDKAGSALLRYIEEFRK